MTVEEWMRQPPGKYDRAIETMLYTELDGSRRVVISGSGWPDATYIVGSVINGTAEERVTRDGDRLVIKLTDESAVYHIDHYDEARDRYACSREA